MRDGVPFVMVRGVGVAHPTLRGAHLYVLDEFAINLRTRRTARRVDGDGSARGQIEDCREEADVAAIVTAVGI